MEQHTLPLSVNSLPAGTHCNDEPRNHLWYIPDDKASYITEVLEPHPCNLIMPDMDPATFERFKASIKAHGQIEPVVLFQGKILDGRQRYNACRALGLGVWARRWEGGMDPVEYVVSKNIHCNHLQHDEIERLLDQAGE